MMKKIAVLDDYQDVVKTLACFKKLTGFEVTVYTTPPTSAEELVERLANQDGLVLIRERTVIDSNLLARLPRLQLISQTGNASDHLDLAACTRQRIAVAEGKGSPVAPAEFCWALIMAASRHIVPYAANLKEGQWQQSGTLGLGRSLNGLTLGIWGYGRIGKMVAAYGQAFGMRVLVWGSEQSRAAALADGRSAAASKEDFFRTADILSLHLRLNPATWGCVEAADLLRMKEDALFVNTSRAGLVQPGALCAALGQGRPGAAAIDVYDQEPAIPATEPLLAMANVLCTPHLGYVEKSSYELYLGTAFDNVIAFAAGRPVNLVNPEVLSQ
jgi:D-3-phosphoglycerate dehydrogenase / 2-oxoglutarate reductase